MALPVIFQAEVRIQQSGVRDSSENGTVAKATTDQANVGLGT